MATVSNVDDLLALATGSQSSHHQAIATACKNFMRKDPNVADGAFASPAGSGQDPLQLLSPAVHTVAYTFILAARLNVRPQTVTIPLIDAYCKTATPVALRLIPEAVTRVAGLIMTVTDELTNIRDAVGPLRDLLLRYPPSLAHLTSIHPIFVHACVKAKYYTIALPVLNTPITEIDRKAYDLNYTTSLNYHYAGAICFAALKRFQEAEEFFEIVVSSPSQSTPAALQLEAMNKLALIQLIVYGKVLPTPKYTHSLLLRIFKSGPYAAFAKLYPGTASSSVQTFAEKEQKQFALDENIGLVRQAIDRAPRWQVRKLTDTYVTLSLPEIGKAVGIESEHEIRAIVVNMIEAKEIHATLSGEGTVTFHDAPIRFSKEGIDGLLRDAQTHTQLLAEFDRELERSREFLQRAVREGSRSDSMYMMDEMDMGMPGLGMRDAAMWEEGDY